MTSICVAFSNVTAVPFVTPEDDTVLVQVTGSAVLTGDSTDVITSGPDGVLDAVWAQGSTSSQVRIQLPPKTPLYLQSGGGFVSLLFASPAEAGL